MFVRPLLKDLNYNMSSPVETRIIVSEIKSRILPRMNRRKNFLR